MLGQAIPLARVAGVLYRRPWTLTQSFRRLDRWRCTRSTSWTGWHPIVGSLLTCYRDPIAHFLNRAVLLNAR
jgi:hypothetical protein